MTEDAAMRVVGSTTAIWRRGGVAATDIAALVGCGVRDEENPMSIWANKIWMREREMRKVALNQEGTEWLQWRKKGVGGSEVAVVVGASPWNSAEKVWKEKTSVVKETAENADMKRGKEKEPIARVLYENLFDHATPACCVMHDEYDFVRASLDGITSDDRVIVEIKSCGDVNHRKLLEVEAVSDPLQRQILFTKHFNYYRYQVLYQLLITNANVCHFVGYNENFPGHKKLAVIELYPEPKEQEWLLRRVCEFWDYVENRQPPDFEWTLPCWSVPSELKIN